LTLAVIARSAEVPIAASSLVSATFVGMRAFHGEDGA